MNIRKRKYIEKWIDQLTDEELEKAYYESLEDCLGSESEMMYEAGYDMVDVLEAEKLEKFYSEYYKILEKACVERKII